MFSIETRVYRKFVIVEVVVRVGILGSRFRYWGDEKFLLNCVKSLLMNELKRRYRNGFEVVVGDEVTGVDKVVYELCRKLNIPVTVVKRECDEPKCLVARTRKVVELSDAIYAVFPEEEFISRESCLSIPGFEGKIRRKQFTHLEGIDRYEKPINIEAEGLLSACIQHEVDHLNGVLILDRASRMKKEAYIRLLKITKYKCVTFIKRKSYRDI